jgi:hypothetical protein
MSRSSSSPFFKQGNYVIRQHRLAFGVEYFSNNPVTWSGHLKHDLLGFDVHQIVIPTNRITNLGMPVEHSGVCHRLGQHWDSDFNWHLMESLQIAQL